MKVTEIKNPTITTLSVEVRTLRIGNKQCTISVFKQIKQIKVGPKEINGLNIWGHIKHDGMFVIAEQNNNLVKFEMPETPNLSLRWFVERYSFKDVLIKYGYINTHRGWVHERSNYIFRGINTHGRYDKYAAYHGSGTELTDVLEKLLEIAPKEVDDILNNEYKAYLLEKKPWEEFVNKCRESDQLFIAV